MSFVSAAPELLQGAAQDLASISSVLREGTATASGPTTAIAAAAHDEVSIAIASMFGSYGQRFQALSTEAQAFHQQFVELMNAGAGAYASAEAANAEQALSGAGLGHLGGEISQGLVGAVTAIEGDGLGGAVAGHLRADLNGVSSAIHGAPASLAGAIQTGGQALSRSLTGVGASVGPLHVGGVANAEQNMLGALGTSVQRLIGPISGASTGLATIAGPYQTLFADTAANLHALNAIWSANPAPLLHQFLTNQTGYAQTMAAGLQTFIHNLPVELANLPANFQASIQRLLAFNPVPYLQQFVANQRSYAQIIAASLNNAAHDFGVGLVALPAAFQSAFGALVAGDVSGAVSDVVQGFVNLFFTGFSVTTVGNTLVITPTGSLADLIPILAIPGQMAQNFTDLLPTGSIPAQISQNFTNVVNTVTDTSITSTLSVRLRPLPPSVSLVNTFGLPVALALDAAGAPINALYALNASATAFVDAVQTGDGVGAVTAVLDSPAVVANGFLNGESTLPLTFNIGGFTATIDLPLDGILVPPTPYTATVTLPPPFGAVTVPVGGTPVSGIAAGLHYAAEQLAAAIA
ncbi:hypothetical protein A5641_07325 [Mycobacterium sp. 1554424.7]|nr:hypothetical protein A5641_07325 [Mycobacterium sp. 1554424.7]